MAFNNYNPIQKKKNVYYQVYKFQITGTMIYK